MAGGLVAAVARDNILGVQVQPVIERFLTQLPNRFTVEEKGSAVFNSVLVEIDDVSGLVAEDAHAFEVPTLAFTSGNSRYQSVRLKNGSQFHAARRSCIPGLKWFTM